MVTLLFIAIQADPTIETCVSKAAIACGVTRDRGGWELTGTTQSNGTTAHTRLVFDGSDRFVEIDRGPIAVSTGFDGRTAWTLGPSGVPHTDILEDRDVNRLVKWVLNGDWCRPAAPVQLKLTGAGTILMTPTDGTVPATLTLDPVTGLPKSLLLYTLGGDRNVNFSAYKQFGLRQFPTHVSARGGDDPSDEFFTAGRRFAAPQSLFRMPEPDELGATFDPKIGGRIPIKRVLGYAFVHPTVNGIDVGWFMLDSGAAGLVLDTAAATECHTVVIGHTKVTGISASAEAKIVRADSFHLGPLTLHRPLFGSLDLRSVVRMFPLKIGGICGYDLLARCDLEIDPYATTMTLHPPGRGPLPAGAAWSPIEFFSGIMCLRCRYQGDHDGWFLLDTGSGDALDFTSTEVLGQNLLKGRETETTHADGIGGGEDFEAGALTWFQIARQRLTDLSAGFHTTKKGVFASPYLAGIAGNQILSLFHVVIDYRNQRISLSWPA